MNPSQASPEIEGFDLPGLDGRRHRLDDLLDQRQGMVVVFWSSLCSHCQRYDDLLSGFGERFPSVGLAAVASRRGESITQLQEAFTRRDLGFLLLVDSESQVARSWRVEQTPRAYLLDSARRLLYRGAIDNFKYPQDPAYEAYLEPAISDLLAGRPVARAESASFGCPIDSAYYDLPALRRRPS